TRGWALRRALRAGLFAPSLLKGLLEATMTTLPEGTEATPRVLGGSFQLAGSTVNVNRMGYGAMQLAGAEVWGPPRDVDAAITVLREAVAAGINHIDTSDYYGPHVTNQIIKQALHPYPEGLVIVTKVGARRPGDKSWVH